MSNISFREGFVEGNFTLSSERVDISNWWGFGYSIPDIYWRVEMLFPAKYDVRNFSLRTFERSDRTPSWLEVDMLLNMEAGVMPVGWRVLRRILRDQIFIPMKWLEHLSGGHHILFPYALGQWKDRSGEVTPICPALSLDGETVKCKPVQRYQKTTTAIAVYQR